MLIINHRVADINIWTESDAEIPQLLQPSFTKFQVENLQPGIYFRIRELDPRLLPLPPLDNATQKRLLQTVGFPAKWSDRLILRSPDVWKKVQACLDHPEMAHISLKWGRVIIRNFVRNELDFFYPADRKKEFFAPFIISMAAFLPNFSAVMLHGAGIARNGVAAVFFAPSKGGKSSTIKLSDGMPVLNDDQIILRKQGGVVAAHGTPFGSITDGPHQSALGGIFLLEKSSQFALTPVPASVALEFIWKENAHLWFVMPKSLRIKAFDLIAGACRQARTFRMRFPKDFIDWSSIDRVLQG